MKILVFYFVHIIIIRESNESTKSNRRRLRVLVNISSNDIIFDNGFGLQTSSDVDIHRMINGRMPSFIFNEVSIFIALDVIDWCRSIKYFLEQSTFNF